MSMIIGQGGNPLAAWSLDVGKTMRMWWWGYGNDLYNIGFPFPPEPLTDTNRIVAFDHGLENVDWPDHHGLLHTVDLRAEASRNSYTPAVFRMQIGLVA